MFYGWGRQSREWPLADGNMLVCAYRYFSLMFIFKVAFKKKWYVIGDSRSQDVEVQRSDLESQYGDVPNLNLWDQWGLFITIAALIVVAVVAGMF